MSCAELEALICDYVDGTLAAPERAQVERHLSECAACAELAQDSAAAVGFMERAAAVEPPPELITRILFDPPWVKGRKPVLAGVRGWFGGKLHAVLQPRFAMGMAMTILSFSMLARFVTPVRQLSAADLQPGKVWAALEDRGYRAWTRTVKFYENLKFVYQIQSTLREWQQQQEEEQRLSGDAEERKTEERKLPLKSPPAQSSGPPGKQ
jgi:hypothetical protein